MVKRGVIKQNQNICRLALKFPGMSFVSMRRIPFVRLRVFWRNITSGSLWLNQIFALWGYFPRGISLNG